jgi:hypothetical protein
VIPDGVITIRARRAISGAVEVFAFIEGPDGAIYPGRITFATESAGESIDEAATISVEGARQLATDLSNCGVELGAVTAAEVASMKAHLNDMREMAYALVRK